MLKRDGSRLAAAMRSPTFFERAVLADHDDEIEQPDGRDRYKIVGPIIRHRFEQRGACGVLAADQKQSVAVRSRARDRPPQRLIPPAPGMFSITTGLPNGSDIFCATARAVMSPRPPGPKPTTILIGRAG